MKQGDLDAYITEYEVLVEMAGYDPRVWMPVSTVDNQMRNQLL